MRLFPALLCAFTAIAASTADQQIDDLARRIRVLGVKETEWCRADSFLRAAALLAGPRPDLAVGFRDAGLQLLRDHPELRPTRQIVESVFQLVPDSAEALVLGARDQASAYTQLADYWNRRKQPERAARLLARGLEARIASIQGFDTTVTLLAETNAGAARELLAAVAAAPGYRPELPRILLGSAGGISGALQRDPASSRPLLTLMLQLAQRADFDGGPELATSRYRAGDVTVTTEGLRDSILFPLGAALRSTDRAAFDRNATLFAKWKDPLNRIESPEQSVEAARVRSRRFQVSATNIAPTPLARARTGVRRASQTRGQTSIAELRPLAEAFLDAVEHADESPEDYALLAEFTLRAHMATGGDNPSIRARWALAELEDLVNLERDFSLLSLEGGSVGLKQQRGKVVLLTFWATWCLPCREEMPLFEKLYREYEGRLTILAVSDEEPEVVRSFLKTRGYTFPVLVDQKRKVFEEYNVIGLPANKIIDRTGRLRVELNEATELEFRRLLKSAGLE